MRCDPERVSSTASAPTERRGARAGTRTRRTARHPEGLERLRILLAGAMGAILIGYALLVPVAALMLLSGGGGSLDLSFAIAVPMWLAAHQIPVEVEGRALGVLPLLPTVVVVVVVALAAAWSVRRLGGRIRHDAGPVVASQAGAAAVVAVLAGALLPGDVSVTTPWASMVGAGLLAGLAAGAGVLRVCGLPPRWTRALPGRPRAALLGARAAAAGLLLSGAVVVVLALAVRAGAVADSFAGLAPDPGASAGVLLLCVGYLPNALVAGVSWSLGPGFAVGAAEYGPFDVAAGPLPPFPLFAAVPAEPVPGWTALVLLLPVGAGVAAGLVCRRALGAEAPLRERLVAAGAAAGATAVGAGIVAAVAGGSLAGGPYDPVSLSPVGVALTALLLLGVPATIAAAGVDELLGRRPSVRDRARTSRTRPAGPSRSRRPGPDGPEPGDGQADGDRDADERTGTRRSGARTDRTDRTDRTGRDGAGGPGGPGGAGTAPGRTARRGSAPHGTVPGRTPDEPAPRETAPARTARAGRAPGGPSPGGTARRGTTRPGSTTGRPARPGTVRRPGAQARTVPGPSPTARPGPGPSGTWWRSGSRTTRQLRTPGNRPAATAPAGTPPTAETSVAAPGADADRPP